jgi:hypothetical protein
MRTFDVDDRLQDEENAASALDPLPLPIRARRRVSRSRLHV